MVNWDTRVGWGDILFSATPGVSAVILRLTTVLATCFALGLLLPASAALPVVGNHTINGDTVDGDPLTGAVNAGFPLGVFEEGLLENSATFPATIADLQ